VIADMLPDEGWLERDDRTGCRTDTNTCSHPNSHLQHGNCCSAGALLLRHSLQASRPALSCNPRSTHTFAPVGSCRELLLPPSSDTTNLSVVAVLQLGFTLSLYYLAVWVGCGLTVWKALGIW